MKTLKKIVLCYCIGMLVMSLSIDSYASTGDMKHNTNGRVISAIEYLFDTNLFFDIALNISNYSMEVDGRYYSASEINKAFDEGAKNLKEAVANLESSVADEMVYSEVDEEGNIIFPDLYFESALLEIMEGNHMGNEDSKISVEEASSIKGSLDLLDSEIQNISGIQYFTNISGLYFEGNSISDISPLQDLKHLEYLVIDNNKLHDISVLENLTELKVLGLGENNISEIGALSKLTDLEVLVIHDNIIADISPLKSLSNLTGLYIGENQIVNISPLEGMVKLENLYLNSNKISDIDSLRNLTKLKKLFLSGNNIVDYSPIESIYTNLEMSDFVLYQE